VSGEVLQRDKKANIASGILTRVCQIVTDSGDDYLMDIEPDDTVGGGAPK
jgi:hypothetical protein